jgi:putative tryptophan/tyrosine transport system substrate-binding protein
MSGPRRGRGFLLAALLALPLSAPSPSLATPAASAAPSAGSAGSSAPGAGGLSAASSATPSGSAPSGSAPRVSVVITGPGPVPGETVEELRLHLRRRFPAAQQSQRHAGGDGTKLGDALDRAFEGSPEVVIPLGNTLTEGALGRPPCGSKIVFMGLSEHFEPQLPGGGRGAAAGVIDACSVESLVRLARRLKPGATRLGWVFPLGDPFPGAAAATLGAAADEVGMTAEPLAVSAADLGAAEALARRVDAVLMLYPPRDLELRKGLIRAVLGGGRPLYTCDSASVGAGATAGLVADPQQVGEATGKLVADVLEGKAAPGARIRVQSGFLAVNLKSACVAGVEVPEGMLEKAIVYEKGYVCPPRPAPAPAPHRGRSPWLLGLAGAAVAAALGALGSLLLRPAGGARG